MSLATIVVHLDAGARCPVRVRLAARIAARHGAHLVGVAATGWPDVILTLNSAVPDSLDIVGLSAASLRSRAEQVARDFEKLAPADGLASFEARVVEGEAVDEAIRHGRASDLVVVGQTDTADPVEGVAYNFPQQVLVHAGTPVLVVPRSGDIDDIGRRVLVAWKSTREAARALRDALPLLRSATSVTLLEVDEPGGTAPTFGGAESAQQHLRRHSIDASVSRVESAADVGEVLLAQARDRACDLIVMGGYGHSRAREWIAGGTTRRLLVESDIAVLVSH